MARITEVIADIFDAPEDSVLIHACNCQGSWGAGVALAFKERYPQAYEVYHEECNTPPSPFHQRSLLGTALLIPPQEDDNPHPGSLNHWIACLYTSLSYGRKKSSADDILESTRKAMGDLRKKLDFLQGKPLVPGELWAVRINSGKFGVTWERTKRVLEQCGLDLQVAIPVEEARKKNETRAQARKSHAPAPEVKTEAQKEDAHIAEENGLDAKTSGNVEAESKKRKHKIEPAVPSGSANQENKSDDDLVAKKNKKKRENQAETAQPSDSSKQDEKSTQDLARKMRKEKQRKKMTQKLDGSTAE